jgi:hypothetical protein
MTDVQPGDRLVIEPNKVGMPARGGVVEEVIAADPPRYRVRWDDGKVSLVSLGGAAMRVERSPQ